MSIKDLQIGDWIQIDWIPFKLYVIDNTNAVLKVSSPSWGVGETMSFQHWRFNFRDGKCWKFLGKSKPNPFYNIITKKLKLAHPVILVKH